jgi:hypothetical protein
VTDAEYSDQEFASKVDWEGGLRADHLAVQGTPLAHAWRELENEWIRLRPLVERVTELLPNPDDDEGCE